MKIEERIKELGLELPEAPAPAAAYVTCKQVGNLVYVSGQGPIINGSQLYTGKVGSELTEEDGYEAAKLCGLNLLAQLKRFLGDLDLIKNVVNVKGFIASTTESFNQPRVMNGMSDLMVSVFEEKGKHTRCALGTNVLPGNIPVEVEMVVEV